MSVATGLQLNIRSMIYVAAEPVPYFWPMRAFIHHNPLHGLEKLHFEQAVEKGKQLFHGEVYLSRKNYQKYLMSGHVDRQCLEQEVERFVDKYHDVPGADIKPLLMCLLTQFESPVMLSTALIDDVDIQTVLLGNDIKDTSTTAEEKIKTLLRDKLTGTTPVYEAVDALYGTDIASNLDELVIKSCLDFFDEGQSVWQMPNRESGFFNAWRDVALRNIRLSLRGLNISEILSVDDKPEGIIDYVMNTLKVPHQSRVGYFTRELTRLHGWAGFIRWRSNTRHYHWTQQFPGDLVDYMAIRLTLALALLTDGSGRNFANTTEKIDALIETRTQETYLRYEFHGGSVLPQMAHEIETALSGSNDKKLAHVFAEYLRLKRQDEAGRQSLRLAELFTLCGSLDAAKGLSKDNFAEVLTQLNEFEKHEGMVWLHAMESHAMDKLLKGVSLSEPEVREKRPFAQALFCIDTRSERIRRHLEAIGDYQTFGIAGFFGVPVSFMELGKGTEMHLCPVLLTPKNVVLELSMNGNQETATFSKLEKALHSLKESVLTPFVTVEAVGLLFGLDMIGKTIAPTSYNKWRHKIHETDTVSRLLLDKLTREQADSIVRAVQRAVIVKAVEFELGINAENINDEFIRDLRESALGHKDNCHQHAASFHITEQKLDDFIESLRTGYRINPAFSQLQLEQLGRIGFTLDEQVRYVSQALMSIGLTRGFSRFVLITGHGSSSENNPYESALDCGACGGNHGILNARVLAQMANKSDVRKKLNETGFSIPDDSWFLPALHNTTTDEISIFDQELLPSSHLVYLDRLRNGLTAASRRCAQERLPGLQLMQSEIGPDEAQRIIQRYAMDWSQVRPEWGLSGNAYFIIGSRELTKNLPLKGRAFLHSYDYRIDKKRHLLENILTGPLVVGQWINMERYFSAVDNERFGSGSKVYHNVVGRFGVMTGNLSDLRTGLPAQTVLEQGQPYHQPIRLITVIEAPFDHVCQAVKDVTTVKYLVQNGWLRLMVIDPETKAVSVYENGDWNKQAFTSEVDSKYSTESIAS